MKKLILIFCAILFSYAVYSQAPQAFNYQSVARDASGNLLTNQTIGVKFSVRQGSSTGTIVYSETFTPTTNQFGLFTSAIGQGAVVSGSFTSINWSTGNYWLQVQLDPSGGTSYTDMGTTQLLSVPYAMYAATSGTSGSTGPTGPTGTAGPTGATGATGGGSTGQNSYDAYGTSTLTVTSSTTTFTVIPGLTQTLTIPANCKVLVQTDGGMATLATGTTGFTVCDFAFFVDGVESADGGFHRIVAANTDGLAGILAPWAFGKTYTLSAGSHTIDVRVKYSQGNGSAYVSSPNTGVLQGVLTVTIINL